MSGNFGVQALCFGALELLKQTAACQDRRLELRLVGPEGPRNLDSWTSVSDSQFAAEFVPIASLSWTKIIRGQWASIWRAAKSVISWADVVLDIGEGDSFSDIYGLRRYINVTFPRLLSILLGKRLVLLPQTIGPFRRRSTRFVAKWLMKRSYYVYARDPASLEMAAEWCRAGRYSQGPDLGFFMPYDSSKSAGAAVRAKSIAVGVNISGLLWHGGAITKQQFGLALDYRQATIEMLRYLVRKPGVEVFLVPHVQSEHFLADDDMSACVEVSRLFPEVRVLGPFGSAMEAKAVISGLDALIAARMHACIAAISTGVPALAVSYSKKFADLLYGMFGYEHIVELRDPANSLSRHAADFLSCLPQARDQITRVRDLLDEKRSGLITNFGRTIFDAS
jgi:polysaccharide pyruvyl transferase WcaK-like protein